jgi:hypothetical protein
MDAQIDLFFLSSFYDIVSDAMRSISSQVDQRNEEALCLPMRLHRMSPSKKSFTQKTFFTMATYEEVPWMHKPISSFFPSFLYDIVLECMRSFDSQVNQRNDEALSMLLHRIVSFQEKLHTKNITHLATNVEEFRWMRKSISFFLPSFFLL